MGVLRSDRVSGLGGANAINGSVFFSQGQGGSSQNGGRNLEISPVSDLEPGSNAFTIEGWFYTDTSHDYQCIFSKGWGIQIYHQDSQFKIYISSTDASGGYFISATGTGSNTAPVNQWNHFALTRTGSDWKIIANGSDIGTASSANAVGATTSSASIGMFNSVGAALGGGTDNGSYYPCTGYISNLRYIIGTALYTSSFTVPSQRLTKTSDTVLLCCQSPGDITKEETGKILTPTTKSINDNPPAASRFAPDVGEDHGTTFGENTVFDTLSYMVPPGGTTTQSNRGRGIFAGGETPSKVNSIEYINIQSMGTAKDFGDLTITSGDVKGLGSSTRGVFRADNNPTSRNVLEYVTFATTSNATDFGDLNVAIQQRPGAGNQTRGIFSGGLYPGSTFHTDMDYITIASTGNAADFGNLSVARGDASALASPTRMVVAGGVTNPGSVTYMVDVDYVTIATIGNATDFGDLTVGRRSGTAVASSTRGVFGPAKAPSLTNVIDYITIASTGNATDFGDALVARGGAGSASNSIRGLFAGGYSPSLINGIEFITIATTGNGADFGDMTFVSQYGGGCSDSHGGIA